MTHFQRRLSLVAHYAIIPASCILLFGCATPKVETEVLLPAEVHAMTGKRNLAVYPILDQWRKEKPVATQELETLLSSIVVEGEPYFSLIAVSDLTAIAEHSKLERQVMRGYFDQATVAQLQASGVQALVLSSLNETSSTNHRNFEDKDGVVHECTEYQTTVDLLPRFIDTSEAKYLPIPKYSGNATREFCDVTAPTGLLEELSHQARLMAFTSLRNGIAPRVEMQSIPLLAEYCINDPSITERLKQSKACDPSQPSDRVRELVSGGAAFASDGLMEQACDRWEQAASMHSTGFSTTYLQGVCAEVLEADLPKAKSLYETASEQMSKPVGIINDAIVRINKKIGDSSRLGDQLGAFRPGFDPAITRILKTLSAAVSDTGSGKSFSESSTTLASADLREDSGLVVAAQFDEATVHAMSVRS